MFQQIADDVVKLFGKIFASGLYEVSNQPTRVY